MTEHSSCRRALRSGLHVWILGWLVLLPTGCGDDDDGGMGTVVSDRQQFEDGLKGLGSFVVDVSEDPGLALMADPRLAELYGMVLPQAAATGWGWIDTRSPTELAARLQSIPAETSRKRSATVQLAQAYGTYDFDALDESAPFPGWVLVDPSFPTDGFTFRFGPEDGFSVEGAAGEPIAVQGELRMLGLQIDDRGTPDLFEDDLIEYAVMEMALAPVPFSPQTVMRLAFALQYDSSGEPVSILVGNAAASSKSDPGASFLGDGLLAVELSMSDGNVAALVQLYSLVERYALRLGATITGLDPATEVFESLSLHFGFGRTTSPDRSPWILAVEFSEPVVDGSSGLSTYAVDGEFSLRGAVVATLSGSTAEIPLDVDVNGDQVVDAGDTCVDVDVVFSDAPDDSQNLCVVLQELWMLFSGALGTTLGSMPGAGPSSP